MGLRRPGVPKDYEEMPGTNLPSGSDGLPASELNAHSSVLDQQFEFASVSVVPDGKRKKKYLGFYI